MGSPSQIFGPLAQDDNGPLRLWIACASSNRAVASSVRRISSLGLPIQVIARGAPITLTLPRPCGAFFFRRASDGCAGSFERYMRGRARAPRCPSDPRLSVGRPLCPNRRSAGAPVRYCDAAVDFGLQQGAAGAGIRRVQAKPNDLRKQSRGLPGGRFFLRTHTVPINGSRRINTRFYCIIFHY